MENVITRHYTMSFPQQLIREPILHNIGVKFGVVFNIVAANVSESHGYLTLTFTAPAARIREANDYLVARGVEVREIPAPQPAVV